MTEPSADGSPRNLISGYLAEQHRRILAGDLQLRLGNDQVHKTRVAVRRYRSTLRVFADVIDVEARTSLDTELSWYGEVLGSLAP